MARGGDVYSARLVFIALINFIAVAVLHIFGWLSSPFLSLLLHMRSPGQKVSISSHGNRCVTTAWNADGFLHLYLDSLHLGSSTSLIVFTQHLLSTDYFPCFSRSVASLSVKSMKRRFPVTTLFGSNGRREP